MPFIPVEAIERSGSSAQSPPARRFVSADQIAPPSRGLLATIAHEAMPTDVAGAAGSGFHTGVAGLAHTGIAATSRLEESLGSALFKMDFGTGQPETLSQAANRLVGQWMQQGASEETALALAKRWLMDAYRGQAQQAADAMPAYPTVADKVVSGFASAPMMLAEAGAATTAMGPGGLPALMALKGSTNPETSEFTSVGSTAKGALEGAAMAAGLHYAAGAPTMVGRAVRAAPVGGVLAAVNGGDTSDIVAESIVMGGLGALTPSRARRFIPAEKVAAEAKAEAVAPQPAPTSPAPPMPPAPIPAPKTPTVREPIAPEPIPSPPVVATPAPMPAPAPAPVAPAPPPVSAPTPPRAFPKPTRGADVQKYPVIAILKARGGVHPDSPLAGELRAMDITPKSHPGLYRKNESALRRADNIPLDEEPLFGGRGLDGADGYIPERALLDAIRAELDGKPYRTGDFYDRQAEGVDIDRTRALIEQADGDSGALVDTPGKPLDPTGTTKRSELAIPLDRFREIMSEELTGPELDRAVAEYEAPDLVVGRRGDAIRDGQPLRMTLYQGIDKGAEYAEGASGPVLGEADYFALSPAHASRYGDVSSRVVDLKNPIVIDSDAKLSQLLGGEIPLENADRALAFSALRHRLNREGRNDGVVVNIPTMADVNSRGERVKRIREVFDHSQVIAFERQQRPTSSTAVAAPPDEVGSLTAGEFSPWYTGTRYTEADPAFSKRPRTEAMSAGAAPGRNYVGAIQATGALAAPRAKATTPLRRESILRDLASDLGITVYEGRMGPRSKSVTGFFRRRIEEVRIRNKGDIETTAHEAAHLIEHRFPEITRAYKSDPALEAELRSVSYDASKPSEGWAEFMRLWMTQPAQAKRLTPRSIVYLDGLMQRNPELGASLTKAREGMTQWFAQDALTRAGSKFGPTGGPLTRPPEWRDWLQQRLFDDLHALKVAETTVRGELPSAERSAYKTARLMRAKHDIAANTLKFGHPVRGKDGTVRFEGKPLNAILSPFSEAGELDAFLRYMVGRRAAELKERGKENLFTDQEIAAMLGLEKPGYRKAADEYQRFNRGLVQFAVDSGVIAPSAADAMSRYFYVPFFREGTAKGGKGSSVSGDVRATHRLSGGTANLKDTLTNILENTDRLIDLAVTNEARLKVAHLAEQPGAGRFLVKIPKDAKRLSILTDEAKRAFAEQKGLDMRDPASQMLVDAIWEDVGPTMEVWQRGLAPKGDNLFAVMRDGKPTYYEVGDPELLRALLAFNRPGTSSPILAGFKNVAQYTITRDPRFMIRNIVRDQMSGGIMGRYGYRPVLDAARGMRSRMAEDANYREFVASGGGMGGLYSPEQVRVQLGKAARAGGLDRGRVLDGPRKVKHALDEVSEAFELATRIGAFQRAREQGVHPREAAYEAREISTDFAMRGDAERLQFFLDTVPFLKAGLTGLHRTGRALTADEHRAQVARRVGLLAVLSAANAAHNYGNPLYDDQSDVMKQTYWHFLVPTEESLVEGTQGDRPSVDDLARTYREGTDKESREAFEALSRRYHHFMLPKNWEIGSIATVAELGVQGILGEQPADVAQQMAASLARNFHFSVVPGALEPIAESVANKDFFTGGPVTPMSEEGKEWGYQYTTRTPLVLRDLGEATGISPIEMDHFLRSYFNAFAAYGLMLADRLAYGDAAIDQPNPMLTSFVRADDSGSQPVRDLLDTYYELDATHQTLLTMAKERDPERTKAFLDEHRQNLVDRARLKRPVGVVNDLGAFEKTVRGLRQLEDVQRAAEQWAEAQENPDFLANAQRQGAWGDIGALKAVLAAEVRKARSRTAGRAVRAVRPYRLSEIAAKP